MRKLLGVMFIGVAALSLCAADAVAGKVEVKGPHICCKQCVKVVAGILKKVDGISDAACSIEDKTVTFTAADEKAAKAGVKALIDGGFFGAATEDGKEIKFKVATAEKGKADKVTVAGVHVCCGMCQNAIKKTFKGATITFDGKGPQKTVTIESPDLNPAEVLQSLQKAGFNGKVSK
jgi:copper chaperone CopZ